MIPIHQGRRVRYGKDGEQIVEDFEGYYLTVEELERLLRDFVHDLHDGYISNDKVWIKQKLKEL
jgi:hypothetical protein